MAQPNAKGSTKATKCLICDGEYQEVRMKGHVDYHNYGMGLSVVGSGFKWRALECDKCHNVQVFRVPEPLS